MADSSSLHYIQPLLCLFLSVAAIGLFRSPRSRGRMLAACGFAGLFLLSWPPADWLFSRPLEAGYPVRAFKPSTTLQALVVLSESVEPPDPAEPYPIPGPNTYRRCEHAIWIYQHYGPFPILVSGGRTSRLDSTLANTMAQLLQRGGVPENMIWKEEGSHSTYENALYSSRLLRDRGVSHITLIVDALSMPRAAACFRKLGIDVTPAPCDFRTFGSWSDELLPRWSAIRRNEDTLHEVLGLAWYRLRGWI